MKKNVIVILLVISLILPYFSALASADYGKEIRFRDIPWGSNYYEAMEALKDLDLEWEEIINDNSPDFKEVIVLIGSPGSGKTVFTENYLVPKGYIRISQYDLKTKEKVLKCLTENIEKGKKIVIDCTNPQVSTRNEYIKICEKYNYPIRAFVFKVTKEFAMNMLIICLLIHFLKIMKSLMLKKDLKKLFKLILFLGHSKMKKIKHYFII